LSLPQEQLKVSQFYLSYVYIIYSYTFCLLHVDYF